MSPVYLNPQTSSPIPFLELKGDHTQHSFQVFGHFHHDDPHNRHNSEEILSLDYSRHEQKKVGKLVLSHEKASDHGKNPCSWLQNTVGDSGCSYGYSFNFREEAKIETPVNYNDQNSRSKWKPSKVKIMQKTTGTSKTSRDGKLDHHDLAKRQNNEGIRMCSDCHTTTTPLWRSGPQGPKSLCNACGIRQRKARRVAMAAAAAAGFGSDNAIVPTMSPPEEAPKPKVQVTKSERGVDQHDKSHTLPIKKRSKIFDAARNNINYTHNNHNNSHNAKKLCFEDFALSSNKDYLNNTKRSFPRDEEEGAILLMALSCG